MDLSTLSLFADDFSNYIDWTQTSSPSSPSPTFDVSNLVPDPHLAPSLIASTQDRTLPQPIMNAAPNGSFRPLLLSPKIQQGIADICNVYRAMMLNELSLEMARFDGGMGVNWESAVRKLKMVEDDCLNFVRHIHYVSSRYLDAGIEEKIRIGMYMVGKNWGYRGELFSPLTGEFMGGTLRRYAATFVDPEDFERNGWDVSWALSTPYMVWPGPASPRLQQSPRPAFSPSGHPLLPQIIPASPSSHLPQTPAAQKEAARLSTTEPAPAQAVNTQINNTRRTGQKADGHQELAQRRITPSINMIPPTPEKSVAASSPSINLSSKQPSPSQPGSPLKHTLATPIPTLEGYTPCSSSASRPSLSAPAPSAFYAGNFNTFEAPATSWAPEPENVFSSQPQAKPEFAAANSLMQAQREPSYPPPHNPTTPSRRAQLEAALNQAIPQTRPLRASMASTEPHQPYPSLQYQPSSSGLTSGPPTPPMQLQVHRQGQPTSTLVSEGDARVEIAQIPPSPLLKKLKLDTANENETSARLKLLAQAEADAMSLEIKKEDVRQWGAGVSSASGISHDAALNSNLAPSSPSSSYQALANRCKIPPQSMAAQLAATRPMYSSSPAPIAPHPHAGAAQTPQRPFPPFLPSSPVPMMQLPTSDTPSYNPVILATFSATQKFQQQQQQQAHHMPTAPIERLVGPNSSWNSATRGGPFPGIQEPEAARAFASLPSTSGFVRTVAMGSSEGDVPILGGSAQHLPPPLAPAARAMSVPKTAATKKTPAPRKKKAPLPEPNENLAPTPAPKRGRKRTATVPPEDAAEAPPKPAKRARAAIPRPRATIPKPETPAPRTGRTTPAIQVIPPTPAQEPAQGYVETPVAPIKTSRTRGGRATPTPEKVEGGREAGREVKDSVIDPRLEMMSFEGMGAGV